MGFPAEYAVRRIGRPGLGADTGFVPIGVPEVHQKGFRVPATEGSEELEEQLADVPRAREALRVLVDDGLATRLGDRVGCSRAAVRFEAIARVS